MLSQQAFNAFLKTLEEPPPYAIFILATTEKHKIIPTILSRCQIFDFRRIQISDMVVHLYNICQQEGIEASPDALHIIAQKADGALRDALSIFDRIVAFSGKKISYEDVIANLNILDYDYYFRLVDALLLEHVTEVLMIFDQVIRKGFDPELFINGLAEHLRNLLVCKDPETLQLLESGDNLRQRYQEQAKLSPTSLLLTALNLANDCDLHYKMARNKRLHVELSLIKMAHIGRAFTLTESGMTAPVESMEKKTPDVTIPAVSAEKATAPAVAPPVSTANQEADTPTNSEVPPMEISPEEPEVTTPQEEEVQATTIPTPSTNGNGQSESRSNGLKRSSRHSLGHLNMEALLAEVEEDLEQESQETADLDLESVQEAWAAYIEQHEKNSIKMLLKNVDVELDGTELVAKVGSKLAESSVREESDLMEFMRSQLRHSELSMRIEIDPTKVVEPPKKQKPLNAKDKYRLMNEINPQIRELITRFGMRPDEE